MNKQRIYWLCQIGGWSSYGFLQILIFIYSTTQKADLIHILGEILQVIFYIGTTHLLRYILIKNDWLNLNFGKLLPRVGLVLLSLSFFNYIFLVGYALASGELTTRDFLPSVVVLNIFGFLIIYFIWTMIYFSFHYFERYNKSLKYEAVAKEIELQNLRSQLNPHFIFNALNSIRALVDEDPTKSKSAITQLSNILRNSLVLDRERLVPFSEEIETVRDYLELETIRYEERLQTEFKLDPKSSKFLIPPLMVQTLVENGIKHGVSTLKEGGKISIFSKVEPDHLIIQIRNTGQYINGKSKAIKGFGISNTKKRLELIYGDQANFEIKNESKETVITEIVIPKNS